MSRKLNGIEQRMHQAALTSVDQTIPLKELEELVPDVAGRNAALNFLLGTGLLKAKTNAKGAVVALRAVLKQELDVKKELSGEESMVLSYIQAADNEGIWTKHLKAKTELHQTVIDRILKSLLQKSHIKVVKSVKHPTRKIYMLAHLAPSVEMTGGPWFTDNELDTEFIKMLLEACAHFIRERSFPKHSSSSTSSHSQPLYPPSRPPSYPTARHVQSFLSQSKITDTQLSIEHVEMLCAVLVLDGLVERVPVFAAGGPPLWDGDDDGEESRVQKDADDRRRRRTKRRRHSSVDSLRLDNESASDSEESGAKKGKGKEKKGRKGPRKGVEGGEKKRVKKRKVDDSEGQDSGDDDEREETRHKKMRQKMDSASSGSEQSGTEEVSSRRLNAAIAGEAGAGGAYGYRAIRQEEPSSVLGWSQAPCSRCPVFDFCKDGGPVNPRECIYFDGMEVAATAIEE